MPPPLGTFTYEVHAVGEGGCQNSKYRRQTVPIGCVKCVQGGRESKNSKYLQTLFVDGPFYDTRASETRREKGGEASEGAPPSWVGVGFSCILETERACLYGTLGTSKGPCSFSPPCVTKSNTFWVHGKPEK